MNQLSVFYIDIHRHEITNRMREIVNLHLDDVNAAVNFDFSVGLHPWWINQIDTEVFFAKMADLLDHPRLLAIGECGLDRLIKTDFNRQIEHFQRQLQWAEQFNKPVIIHCVRAFNELLILRRQYPSQPWIIHSFNNKPHIAEQLIANQCYLSFGQALLKPNSNAARCLQQLPARWIFFETDDQAQLSIGDVYTAASTITGVSVEHWQRQILQNYQTVFNHD